jgi:DNA-binding response OmpR family regulator
MFLGKIQEKGTPSLHWQWLGTGNDAWKCLEAVANDYMSKPVQLAKKI